MKKASLEQIREMAEAGKLYHNPDAPTEVEELGDDFWREAQVVRAKDRPHSVHLKLEPEVFEFFKRQGKGHLTRMQNVLKAYARAHK
jgi:uncharacterized protein (DUF4415 family)